MWNVIKMMIVFLDKNVTKTKTSVNMQAVTIMETVLDFKNVVVEDVSQFASMYCLSKGLSAGQAQSKVEKIKNSDFSYWA
jgi:hypothetical protein